MQDFRAEVSQFGGFLEVKRAHRFCTFYIPGVVVVHSVYVSPDLYLVGIKYRTKNRSGIVASAALEVVDSAVVVAAYIPLGYEEFGIGFEVYHPPQTHLYVLHVGLAARSEEHTSELQSPR